MGQLIKFPVKPLHDENKEFPKRQSCEAPYDKQAKLLFFTGIRYERRGSLPSERLQPPIGRT